jgi:hypothetical protein
MLYLRLTSTGQQQAVAKLNDLMSPAGAETGQQGPRQPAAESEPKRSTQAAGAKRRPGKPAANNGSNRHASTKPASAKSHTN